MARKAAGGAGNRTVLIPYLGHGVVLVPREQMRRTTHGRYLSVPGHLLGLAAAVPTPPPSWDGSRGRAVKYPVLGNDRYGDCYYADMCHAVQTWTAWGQGSEASFDAAAVVARYKTLSGGDNGLSDDQVFPEWKRGIVGPNGPHRILDDMTVDPRNDPAIQLGMWLFCGASYTASLPDAWVADPRPGQVWDRATPNPRNGHAMHLSGYTPDHYQDETWGFDPCVRLTPAGLKGSDPEVTVQFSLEMFDKSGVAPHNGMSYDQLATLWVQLGGQNLPPWSGPGPGPGPGPAPGPGPTPVPVAELKRQIDAVFAQAEAALRRYPSVVRLLEQVRAQVDAVLARYGEAGAATLEQVLDDAFKAAAEGGGAAADLLAVLRHAVAAFLRG